MRRHAFRTVDVFTTRRFGGNPLAVFTDARGLSDREMQALAAEMNYSETTFVLPPDDPAHTARVRIFNRSAEMPFAGHPNVGTGFVLADMGRDRDGMLLFEEVAGLVAVTVARDGDGRPTGAEIEAPQPLAVEGALSPAEIAPCLSLDAADLVTDAHPPLVATVGVDFVLVEVTPGALARAAPNLPAFTRAAKGPRHSIHLYARDGERLEARMFAPLAGTWEDPATGSANAALGALLLSLTSLESARFDVVQGRAMGRESHLRISARREGGAIRARVGGPCVPVFEGWVEL